METNHFTAHKKKYTSFVIVAIPVIFISYIVYRTEAFTPPLPRGIEDRLSRDLMRGDRCPRYVRRFLDLLPADHPCVQREPDSLPVVVEASVTEDVTVSEGSSTPSQATSTPTEESSVATTTQEVPTPEEGQDLGSVDVQAE